MFDNLFSKLRERFDRLAFSKEQERALIILFAGFLIIGGLFVFLNSGGKAQALPAVAVPELPTIAPVVVIDVAGKVNKPGVYKLPSGSRAVDALTAAGGAKKGVDLSDINLAHVLSDGEQIVVGAPKVVTSSRGKGSSKSSGKVKLSGPLNINTATAAQLDALPGIGPVMAARIITYREKNGLFKDISELRKVSGMGASKFAQLQNLIKI
jgi:competence protein ComEA